MQIPAAGRTGLYRNDWLVACTGRMYTGRTGLYWKDVHWKDQLVLEGSACIGRISLYWKDWLGRKDLLVLKGSACIGRIGLYWKDWLVLEGLACTERISLCITLL